MEGVVLNSFSSPTLNSDDELLELSATLKFDFWPRVVLSSIFMDFHFKNNSFSNHLYVGLKRPIYRFRWTFVALRPSANY